MRLESRRPVGAQNNLSGKYCNTYQLMTGLLTLTSRSQPHDTMIGFCVFGEKRTQDVQSV